MVKHLSFGRTGREIFDCVTDCNRITTKFGGNRRFQTELKEMKARFHDYTRNGNRSSFRINRDSRLLSRLIPNTSVKGILQIIGILVEFGSTITFQTAANHHLIKTIKPSQTTRLVQRHVFRMNGSLHGGLPTKNLVGNRRSRQTHSTS